MNKPDVLLLVRWVDEQDWHAVESVLKQLSISYLMLDPDAPLAPQAPPGQTDGERLEERLVHYVEACRVVILINGHVQRPGLPEHEGLLARIWAALNWRTKHGAVVTRDWPGRADPRLAPEVFLLYYIPDGDTYFAHALVIRHAILTVLTPVELRQRPSYDISQSYKRELTSIRRDPPAGADTTAEAGGDIPTPGGAAQGEVEIVKDPRPPASPEHVPPEPDELFCSVYSPRLAAPGDEILVQAFAHLREQEAEVAAMSAAADPGAAKVGARRLDQQVAGGERLGFHLTLRGAEVDAPDQEFVWGREPLAAQFGVYFPETSQPRDAVGTVLVTKQGVPVGHVKFTLRVVTREQKAGAAAAERVGEYSRYHTAFVSYASKDRERVLPRVQALAAARIKVFQDFIELEPGERWERGLYKHIDECDVFFLFWSQAARDSEWVRREAEYARGRQEGQDDRPPEIIPIIIEGPPPVEPPPELNFLHFNDKYIYLLKGVGAEAEARRKEQS